MTRESRATYILATQSTTSLAVELKDKCDVLILNISNHIIFTVADETAAQKASALFGKHTVTETSKSVTKGVTSTNYKEVEKPIYSETELRGLKKYQCIIKHASGRHEKVYMPPVGKNGKTPFFYYRDRFNVFAWLLYLLQV
jgi:type IV secretory pathway TraG/TraD family ATPase VirD4